MKNNDNTSSDLEGGMAVEGTVALNSPRRRENPSVALNNPNRTEHDSMLSRIFQNLTKTTTQQKALLLLCVAGTIFDPLFFYVPMINEGSKCMKSNRKLGIITISLRSLVDVLHFLQWSFYYEKKWKAGGSNISTSTTSTTAASMEISLVNPNSFSPRNSKLTGRLIEIMCILPLPQAATLAILIIKGCPRSQQAVTLLKFSVLSQFVLRAFRVFPSFHEATANSVMLVKRRFWIGAGFNLLLFVIASHVLGAFWYLLSVGRTMDCWKSACKSRVGCNIDSLYCGGPTDNKTYLEDYCPIQQATNSSAFDFGIYLSALESNIVGSTRFSLKLFYCFWWGLRNLSSLGQNLTTSAYEWEIMFSICISILGLILFSLFIGNMQAFFQYRTNKDLVRMDQIENKRIKLLKWEPFQWLPKHLQDQIILCPNDSWLKTTEVNIQTTLNNLPNNLGKSVKNTIFSELQLNVRLLQVLHMFDLVKPEVFAKGRLVLEKGQPIKYMVFVLNGELRKQSGTGSTAQVLRAWDFFGEELLKAIVPGSSTAQSSSIEVSLSTADIKACTNVDAFILNTEDLQSLVVESKYKEEIIRLIGEPRGIQDAKASRDTDEDLVRMKDKMNKIEKKQRELLKWEPFQWLPKHLQDQIILCTNDIWLKTTEVNLQTTLNYLPNDLGKRIKDTIFSRLMWRVRLLQALNTQAPHMFNLVKPEVFAKGRLVLKKGQPIKHMVFVLNGELRKQSGTGSTAQVLRAWDFFGEELLKAIVPGSSTAQSSSIEVSLSTADIKTCTKVEAFILDVKDLRSLIVESNYTIEEIIRLIEEPGGIQDTKDSRDTDKDLVNMKGKMDKVIKKQKELLKWEPFQGLPRDLQVKIMLCDEDSWLETTEVNLQTTLDYLPDNLGKRIKDTFFFELQLKVRLLQALNTQALNMFNLVKPEVFAKASLVFKKGQPIQHMVFVLNGKLRKQSGTDRSTAQVLRAWDFCGEELLIEVSRSSLKHELMNNLPTSTVDIQACTKVEAFILDAGDLQTLVNKSNDTTEILMSIMEHKVAREDAIKKQKKVAEEKPTGLTKSASFKESSAVGGTP